MIKKKKVIVVESPNKARNISQYLKDCTVLATGGHVRDLPSKQGSVLPDEDFRFTWKIIEKAEKALKAIHAAVKDATCLVLATDLDREGEAISWHLLEYLKENGALRPDLEIQRVVFNAVTKDTILRALQSPQELNIHRVEAYLARLGWDYLYGFTLSPFLWRKLPGAKSAGRVQSVALRIVVEREEDIARFQEQEYWSIHGLFSSSEKPQDPINAQLIEFDHTKIGRLDIKTEDQAQEMVHCLKECTYHVDDIKKKAVQRQPSPPFITSTLQQDAARRLGFSPAKTMQVAQKLYEGVSFHGDIVGLITYMRTDSLHLTPEFITQSHSYICQTWGDRYLSPQQRVYKAKKHSQEAHEAIRPTDVTRLPDTLRSFLENDAWRLYKLIWDRTLASQMSNACYDQTTVLLKSNDTKHIFRATGSVLTFDGFLVLYEESREDDDNEEKSAKLSDKISMGEILNASSITPDQHFTQPPGRYSEASLIKKLEEMGIGRPGTYARILQVLQERGYVRKEKKTLIPEELGVVVVAFLRHFFPRYVDYDFTSSMEDILDSVSVGETEWRHVLEEFWGPFFQHIEASKDMKIAEILEVLEKEILPLYIPDRACPRCQEGVLNLRLGKTGPFVGCSRYPECNYIAGLQNPSQSSEGKVLGEHPSSLNAVELKVGPYGAYIACDGKRVSSQFLCAAEDLTLEKALWLLELPKTLGEHPEGGTVILGIGRFGPYVKFGGKFISVKRSDQDLMNFSLDDAFALIEKAALTADNPKRKRFPAKKTSSKEQAPKKSPAKKTAPKKKTPSSALASEKPKRSKKETSS